MGKVIGKFNIDECSKTVYDFIIKYKSIILITFFIGVVVNAVDVFTIKTMPSYPNNDCIKLIGDTVVIKLSD